MKDVLADCHVFGSDGGYRTLVRSPGVAADEVRQLEQFDFSVDFLGADADRAFSESGSAYLLPLRSGRFAIRRVLLDSQADNYGRRALIAASIVLTDEDYLAVACVDGGSAGSGLENVVHRMDMWHGMCAARRGSIERIRVPVLADDGARRFVPEDFELFDAWHTLLKGGEDRGAWVSRGGVHEARLLALPSVLARKAVLKYHWGIGVMRQSVPRMVASYLDPSLVPAGAMPVQLPAGAGFRSSFTEHARKLVLSFPVSPWHPHRDWLDLKQAHKQTVEELEEQVALGEQRAKERDAAIVLANKREEARMGLSDECLRKSTEIHDLNKTLEENRTESEAEVVQLETQLRRWRIASFAVPAAMVVLVVLALWLLPDWRPKIFTDDSSGAASASTNPAPTSSDSSEGVRSSPSGADQRRGNATTPPRDADSRPGAGR
jgi:hypothetical protein